MNRDLFLKDLKELESSFASLSPELEVTVRDDLLGVEGFVVVSNTYASIGGPLGRVGKGGTRVTPQVTLEEIRMLAGLMTLKNSAANLPLGGAKSGLRADPNSPDFEKKFRRFATLVKPLLIENGGLWGGFGFDVGMKSEYLIWACESSGSLKAATGKPIEMGGTDYDREGIAGLGVAAAAQTVLNSKAETVAQSSFAVQGVGAMGAAVIKYFSEYGGKLCAVSDPRIGGAFRLKSGASDILIKSLGEQDFATAKLLLQNEAEKLKELDDVLYQKCDILFPAAMQEVINDLNAAKIQARYVIEAANNPCVGNSRGILQKQGILVIPDFIANPGGIVAAFVEMSSNTTTEENIKTKSKVIEAKNYAFMKIQENTSKLLDLMQNYGVGSIEAGRYLALAGIFKGKK